jgi:peptidoglycan/LPS O-acetylase OafA/YrhL
MPRSDDPALTSVRGLAAFWVFVYHAWLSVGPQRLLLPVGSSTVDLTPLASAGWAGVGVFYVLSGFLLWSVFDDWASGRSDRLALRQFAERRALRILPPYYAQVALLALVGLATTAVEPPTWKTLAYHLTLSHGLSFDHFQAVNNVWWTLSIEAQFYVLLPLLALAIRRFGWAPVLAAGLATMLAWRICAFEAFRAAPLIERVWILEQLPGRIDQFLAGMFASHLARAPQGRAAHLRSALTAAPGARWLLVAVAPATMIALVYLLHVDRFYLRYWEGHPWLYAWHLVAGIAVAISLYALAIRDRSEVKARGVAARAVIAFGVISYSFYLWHELLLRWLSMAMKSAFGEATLPAFAANFAIGLPLCTAVAFAWFWCFERPFLAMRHRLRATSTPAR